MSTKALLLLGLLFLTLFSVTAMTADVKQSATMIASEGQQVFQAPLLRAPCTLVKHNGTPSKYFASYQTGVGTYTYFNPALICAPPVYPFEIKAFSFSLYDPGGYVWPALVDIVVYAMGTDSCAGPGTELCRYPLAADQATYGFPTVGTYTFPTTCCVKGPFFIGLEYRGGAAGSTPSVLFDGNAAPVVCDNWMYWTDGLYHEWYNFWNPPVPGYPMFSVGGETRSANCPTCDWQPGDAYKMHFPQLPNDTGWDVNATLPVVLADDWRCTQTGWVKDIHFWGSWRNGIVGQSSYFVLSIHADIPADPTQNMYSRPGPTLWERDIASFNATPVDPPTMEGWYDPSTGEVLYSDHGAYFQYNVCLDSLDWFHQTQGTVYWLNITAVLTDPQTTKWGWKSTLNHYSDDAVWALSGQLNWVDMFEPGTPVANPFFVQIDRLGSLTGGGGGFYGQGWYFYPLSEWWNIWFYDHPFTYEREKLMVVDFDLFKLEPQFPSYIEVAFNWASDTWSLEQPPQDSMPPLPGVIPESLYIRRQTVLVGPDLQGHFHFDHPLRDYNPEWVSMDVRGYNFVIPKGTLIHECRQSLDLAFVITSGVTQPCDCRPGDANGDATRNISDAVYLISYIFSHGAAPVPYPICSGDANCDCTVNISDAVYLIGYIFSGGAPPCDCSQWLINCGPPLR